jgi:hypothetical protein
LGLRISVSALYSTVPLFLFSFLCVLCDLCG